jgi:hypothetical protein
MIQVYIPSCMGAVRAVDLPGENETHIRKYASDAGRGAIPSTEGAHEAVVGNDLLWNEFWRVFGKGWAAISGDSMRDTATHDRQTVCRPERCLRHRHLALGRVRKRLAVPLVHQALLRAPYCQAGKDSQLYRLVNILLWNVPATDDRQLEHRRRHRLSAKMRV